MPFMNPFPAPRSVLGRHRVLSPTASVRVSPLCLGSMNFGESWSAVMGECDKKTTEEMLDCFYENGGNFIDTANLYQDGESEMWLGDWMKSRGVRQQMGKRPRSCLVEA
ncbi:putative norsolorinic acid reductase [Ilyonectria robusta]